MKEQKIKQDVGIGHNIKRLRRQAGLTQEATIAKMQLLGCEMTRVTYVKIEGETHHIRVSELRALQKIFKVDFNDFFEEAEKPENVGKDGQKK